MPIVSILGTDQVSASRQVINDNFAFLASGVGAALSGSQALNFPSIPRGESADLTITATGAVAGHPCFVGAPAALEGGLTFCAWISAADTITVRVSNVKADGTEVNPASATWTWRVF